MSWPTLIHVALLSAAASASAAAADLHPRQTPAPTSVVAAAPKITALTSCHLHGGSQLYCSAGTSEYLVQTTPTQTTDIPAQFTDCHNHGSDLFCLGPGGQDVQVQAPLARIEGDGQGNGGSGGSGGGGGGGGGSENSHKHCHSHAGVEHCVDDGQSEETSQPSCNAPQRNYNIFLRVGLLFVIMATSAAGVFGPILLHKLLPQKLNVVFIVLKQFGTGIIISTAFVHLFTHASLMFGNKCLGHLEYEATTAAILLAGLFLSFLVEYTGQRVVLAKTRASHGLSLERQAEAVLSTQVVSILVMEAGILFHSLLIGLTLVVADDRSFITLFIVILFHQVFEGLALGTRIATIDTDSATRPVSPSGRDSSPRLGHDASDKSATSAIAGSSAAFAERPSFPIKKKLGLAVLFAFVTPIGMAIGIGVLQKFNGNDKSTIIAIGTLDALSAGILVWTGLVEMWAADWMTGEHGHKAELADAPLPTVLLGGFGLVLGLAVMSLLGKWA